MIKDRPLRLRLHGSIFGAWVVLNVVASAIRRWPESVGRFDPSVVTAPLRPALEWVAALVPFGLVEVTGALLAVLALVRAIPAVVEVLRRRRRVRNAAVRGVLVVVSSLCVLDMWGGFVGGIRRTHLGERVAWAEAGDASVTSRELTRWTLEVVLALNAEYAACSNRDGGIPPASRISVREIDAAVEQGYAAATRALDLPASFARTRGDAKASSLWPVLSYLGCWGYYSPYTQEAIYNPSVPAAGLPGVIAHEKAHQRGVGFEDEASLAGYVACIYSDEPFVRYSGYWDALFLTLPRLYDEDRDRCKALIGLIAPGAMRDLRQMQAFARHYDTRIADASQETLDVLMKAQGEKRGIAVYEDISLFVAFARRNQDSLLGRTSFSSLLASAEAVEAH